MYISIIFIYVLYLSPPNVSQLDKWANQPLHLKSCPRLPGSTLFGPEIRTWEHLTHDDTCGEDYDDHCLALFDMPNLNRFNILSISIFCKIAMSISISIFSKITISISIAISIFLELPYRYRYRYRYFSELPYRYRYRYRYFQLLHIDIDIDIDIFQKCRYIDNRYFKSIF